MSELLWL